MDDVTTFESGFESRGRVQRLDVIPAGPARRRWTSEAKARIVAESLVAGANVSAVARRHGLLPQQLYAWRRRLSERLEAGEGAAFVPAMLAEGRPPALSASSASAEIRIELGATSVFVPDGVSAGHVERVLLAVRATS